MWSVKQSKIDALATQIRRNKTMAINANNPDFKTLHPDWIRDAQSNNFTQLIKKTTEDILARQKRAADRQHKTHDRRKD